MSEHTIVGIIGIFFLIAMLFSRMAVAYVMALVGFIGYSYLTNLQVGLRLLSTDIFSVFSSYGLTLIPLFVFMGYIAFYSGVSSSLYDVAYKFVGRVRGGLAMATVMACAAFGAVCGSATATTATMGTIGLPEMERYKYGSELSTGCVASGGGLGALMPPSVVLIIYGILTEQSIGTLFIAGVVPAIFMTFLFMVAIRIYCIFKPEQGPKGEKFTLKEMILSLGELWETLAVFLFVMGGLVTGLFTPTKSGAVGAFAILMIVMLRRKLSWEDFKNAIYGTLKISCMVIMLIAGATVFGHFLALTRIPLELATAVGTLDLPPWIIIGLICFIYLLGGCFIDSMALIMLTIPIFYPIVLNLGYDPIWFGIIIVLVTHMGIITPPVGTAVYVTKGIAKDVPLVTIFKGSFPFLLALIVGTGLMTAFPEIVTFLPGLFD
ncbi:TRAP transporter large permease [Desulfobacula sp.]|uniref:TRAP transporter large permease n=1 Tax=Desulfobacula sp. TaxID=2593537 RepID=UPI0026120C4A|nr:TRAP transporter large permease [Desulfobacula sp.]